MFQSTNIFYSQNRLTPLLLASLYDRASTCKLLFAVDDVDENAVSKHGETTLDVASRHSSIDAVRALLELNVDTSKTRSSTNTNVEIVQLLNEHRKRSV